MNYDIPYTLGATDDKVSASVVAEALKQIAVVLDKIGVTNDNGIISARDKVAQYVTQVIGNRDAAYKQLYEGFKLAHSDINNVGTKTYYVGVLKRLNEAIVKYITNHADESSTIFMEDIDPAKVLADYTRNVQQGMPLDHAFWMAFTYKKDPYDIRTGKALPPTVKTNNQFSLDDAGKVITEMRDQAGKLLTPGTKEYNDTVNKNASAGDFNTTAVYMIGGVALLAGIAYVISQNKKKSD